MKIIKKGKVPYYKYILKCRECKTVFEVAEEYVMHIKDMLKEYNESIREVLNKKEKEYLRGVINPFRENVEYVCKKDWIMTDKQYIGIKVNEEYIELPGFKKGTMYKGMEIDRRYTLEELGL